MVEIVIAASIMSVALVSLVAVYGIVEKLAFANVRALQATELTEEGVEALKFMRDSSWTTNIATLTNSTPYRFYWNGTTWTSTTSARYIDNRFDRSFVLSAVNRDPSTHNVVTSGGTVDSGSRKAVITVGWKENNATSTKSAEIYIFNLFSN